VLLAFVTFFFVYFSFIFTCSFYDQNGSAILLYRVLPFLFIKRKFASNDHVNCILAFYLSRHLERAFSM